MSETPWQVRYVRWWNLSHAHWCRLGGNRDGERQHRQYAANQRPFWLRTGKVPLVSMSEGEALAKMATPPWLHALYWHERRHWFMHSDGRFGPPNKQP